MKFKKRTAVVLAALMLASLGAASLSSADSNEYKAYISGYPDGSFKPAKTVTRAEVAVIVASLIRNGEKIDDNVKFADIQKGHFAYDSVNYLRAKDILSKDNGGYDVKKDMTRGEFCSVIVKAYKLTKGDAVKDFADVKDNMYKSYIDIAVSNGYMSGYPDGSFKPDKAVSRAEAVSIINKITGRPGEKEVIEKLLTNPKVPNDVKSTNWAYYNIVSATNTFSFGKMTPLENKKEEKKEEKTEVKKDEQQPSKIENDKKDLSNEKIDINNLKDGEYKVSVELWKANGEKVPSELSMANNAIEKTAILKVESNKAYLQLSMNSMTLSGFDKKGHMEAAWYYDSKQDYIKGLDSSSNTGKEVTVVEEYTDASIEDGSETKFPKTVKFPVKVGEDFVYLKVQVDIMKSFGGANPDAVVKIDWKSIKK